MALSVWRDEFHGRPGERQALDIDEDEDNPGAIDDEEQVEQNRAMGIDNATSRPPRSSPSVPSSRASSPPAASGAESSSRGPGPSFSEPEPDEDEEFWKSLDDFGDNTMGAHAPPPPPPKAAPASAQPSGFDDDEDMWDIIDQVEKEASGKQSAAPKPSSRPAPAEHEYADPSDWDDMYAD